MFLLCLFIVLYSDYAELLKAKAACIDVSNFISDEEKTAKRLHRLHQISLKIYKFPVNLERFFTSAERDYIGQCAFTILYQKKTFDRQVIGFSDSIIIARKKLAGGSRNLSFKFLFLFKNSKIIFPDEKAIKFVAKNGLYKQLNNING